MSCSSGQSLESYVAYRYSVYDLLRRIFLWEFPLELFTEVVLTASTEMGVDEGEESPEATFKEYLRAMATEHLPRAYRDIHIEYTRLFVGPRHLPAPPYESVYRSPDKLMMQDETMSVRAAYAQSGFRVARIQHVPDDSVGIELEFMCAMNKATGDALREKDCTRALTLAVAQQEFCNDHLLQWVPKFCDDIFTSSTSEFWQNVAVFTREFIQEETAALSGFTEDLKRLQESERSDTVQASCASVEVNL
jgi:TorA maturation chaperone TorD